MWQYREMESNCASAPAAREPENIEAARERETNASHPLTAQKARKWRETNVTSSRETESMGAREINVLEKETDAVRRDGEPDQCGQEAAKEGGGCQQTSGGCGGATPFTCKRGNWTRATIDHGPRT
jgi:hypothetical protein